MTPAGLLSRRAYARHRGVAESAVRRAIAAGRISVEPCGRIDPARADAEWRERSVPRMPNVQPGGWARKAPVGPTEASEAPADVWASRARREAAEAALAELRLEEQRGRLVDRNAVEAEHARLVIRAREALLQVAARLAPLLVDQADQSHIARVIDAEHRRVLDALSRTPTDTEGTQ